MAIKKAEQIDLSNTNVSILIYGRPGTGKTQTALSAESPLLVDLEDGVGRVEACYRSDTMQAEKGVSDEEAYNTFINDLTNEDLSSYKTIIIDTVGKFIELATPIVIKENASNSQKDGKTLSLKGYGAVKQKFIELNKLLKSKGKDIIWVAHSTETMDNDMVKNRILIPGSTKDSIWDDIDLGGFMEFLGKERVIHFKPTQSYDAKGTNGIEPTYKLPQLKSTQEGGQFSDNHFMADLIRKYKTDKINAQKLYSKDSVTYKKAMELLPEINAIDSIDGLSAMVVKLKNTEHALTSKRELAECLKNKADELGAIYDKEQGKYTKSN